MFAACGELVKIRNQFPLSRTTSRTLATFPDALSKSPALRPSTSNAPHLTG